MRRSAAVMLALLTVGLRGTAAQPAGPAARSDNTTVAGVRLGPVPELLYQHLPALPRGQGLVVEDIRPDTILADGGLRRHDIVLTCDGARLERPADFARALAANPGQPHRAVLLRGGRTLSLALRPAGESVPKAVLKPGGPPAVALEAEPLSRDTLKVSFRFYSPDTGKLEKVTCSGSLPQIEDEVRQLGKQNRMPPPVQDLVGVALQRLRAINSTKAEQR